MLWLILIAVVMWVLQCVFGVWQLNKFNRAFKALRHEGRVAVGKAKGKLEAGVVVLLCIDQNAKIVKGKKMQGLTIFAEVKPFTELNGIYLLDIHKDSVRGLDKQTKRAVLNAVENFKQFTRQEEEKKNKTMPNVNLAEN